MTSNENLDKDRLWTCLIRTTTSLRYPSLKYVSLMNPSSRLLEIPRVISPYRISVLHTTFLQHPYLRYLFLIHKSLRYSSLRYTPLRYLFLVYICPLIHPSLNHTFLFRNRRERGKDGLNYPLKKDQTMNDNIFILDNQPGILTIHYIR